MTGIGLKITPTQRLFISIAAVVTNLMVMVDMTIANVALPEIQGSLAATQDQIAWVLTSYLIATAIGTPLTGALVSRVGFRRLYLAGIVAFGASSMLCGTAVSLPELVFFRALQGFSGAAFMPLFQSLIFEIYPREKQGSAMSMFAVGAMFGPLIGPTLGGYLTDSMSWRWIFFINIPFAVVSLIGMYIFMPRRQNVHAQEFDYFGFGMFAVAVASLQLMFDRGHGKEWFTSNEIIVEAAVAAVAAYLFLLHTLTRPKPFIDPALFRDRNFVSGLTVMFLIGMMVFVPTTVTPLFLQHIQGYDATSTGLVLAPRGLGVMLALLPMGWLVNRIDSRFIVFTGVSLITLTFFAFRYLTVETPVWLLVVLGAMQTFGLGCIFVPLNLISFTTLPGHLRHMGASLINLGRSVGGSLGLAVFMGYVAKSTDANYVRLGERLTLFNPNLPAGWSITDPASLKMLTFEILRQATVIAYDNAFSVLAVMSLALLPLVLFLRKPVTVSSAPAPDISENAPV